MWNEIKKFEDEKENVIKFVYTNDNAVVESVLYKYPTYDERTVICCSVQSGCPVGCRFCGTGEYFNRNLTIEEIVSQVDYSIEQTGVNSVDMKRLQVMFMSMGEPFLNLKALLPALHILYNKYPNAKLLISTSAPTVSSETWTKLIETSIEIPTVGLQFSVHESTDEARNKLVPFKAKMSLWEIAERGYMWMTHVADGRKPFFNYCAHDKNSTEEDADRILKLFNPNIFNATVSVICEKNDGLPATNEHQRQLAVDFSEKLVTRGFDVRVFDPAGQDTIGGGCGQLWYVQDWFKNNPDKVRKSVGYGLPDVHVPTKEKING